MCSERYTLAHFTAEETFMRVTEYPDFEAHKSEHRRFVARVAEEKKFAIRAGTLSLDIIHFLRDWLVNHIMVSDRAYASFTKKEKRESLVGRLFRRFF